MQNNNNHNDKDLRNHSWKQLKIPGVLSLSIFDILLKKKDISKSSVTVRTHEGGSPGHKESSAAYQAFISIQTNTG